MPETVQSAPIATEPARSGLRMRRLPVDTYREAVAYLPRRSLMYRPEEFQAMAKIEVRLGARRIFATLNVIDDERVLAPDEIGLSITAFDLLAVPEGTVVDVEPAEPPESLEGIRRKVRGEELSTQEIHDIIRDIADLRYSRMEIAAFLIASASYLSTREVLDLTLAMAKAGRRLQWPNGLVVDKHCIGGIPGNRTSMIVVPIVAAHGLLIPKTSSRAITSPAGTADTMEVLARVNLDIDEMRAVVAAENGCIVWGGHVNLSPADDVLISVERPLAIDTPEQMVASILSKKLAAGSSRLLVDIPMGPTAKIRHQGDGTRIRKLFEYVGRRVGLELDIVFTDGSQPVGRGIGPLLEARDVMKVLACERDAPTDLRAHALTLAGRVLEFDPALRGGSGRARAEALLDSGAALEKMKRIMAAQGQPPARGEIGALVHDVVASRDGRVSAIDCYKIARIARLAGAPNDKGAGIDLFKKVGDPVERGEPLYRIHAGLAADFRFAVQRAGEDCAYRLAAS
jgi:thymidine phosphorylase